MPLLRLLRTPWLAVFAATLLLCCGGATVVLFRAQDAADALVRHSVQVQATLQQSRVLGLRAEVSRRGYLLTGDPLDLAAMRASRAGAMRQYARLKALTADNPRQRRTLAALDRALVERFAAEERTVVLARDGQREAAVALLAATPARALTRHMTALLDRAGDEEARLLAAREARTDRSQARARTVLVASVLLIVLIATAAWLDRRGRARALADANRQLARDNRRRKAAEAEFRLLADNATDAVFRVGLDGAFTYASPSTRQVFGVDPAAVIGQSLYLGVHRDDRPTLAYGLQSLAAGERERLALSYRVMRDGAPGDWRWVEAHVGLLRGPDGEPAEIISSIRDISRRVQLETELEAARRKAEAAAAAKSAFLAEMSHEIRTPMNGVIGFTELLLAGDLAGEQRRQAELIADSGRAMLRLLNDILDWSKVEAGQMRVADEPFDVRHAIRACVRLVTPAIEAKRLTFYCHLDDAIPDRVRGDGLRVRQILLNLLGNAAKFTEMGEIAVIARVSGGELAITVTDTGIGIPADRQNAIFEAFVQAEAGTAARFGGTGLGLSISAQLATLMGGRLALESEPGAGSRFTLTLPLIAAVGVASGPAPVASPAEVAPLPPLRVLVAEDHDVNQLLIGGMLRHLGCEVEIAAEGAAALECVARARAAGRPHDLVLMDMQMPVLDGPATARRLRETGVHAAELPIVALTANAYADDVASCLAAGMQAHISKPVSLAALDEALRRWAVRRSAPTPARRAPGPSATARARYAERRAEALAAVEALAARDGDDDTAASVAALLHKLAGVAAMFGEGALGDAARALETSLANWSAAERHIRLPAAARALAQAAAGTPARAAG